MEELAADAAVEADAARHVVHVGADLLAQIGHFVDERDLHRQERVGGILGQFRRLDAGEHDRRLDQIQRAVQPAHHLPRAFGLGADHHAIGAHEVADRIALAQEFGVGGDVEIKIRARRADDLRDAPAGADGHGGFRHDHGVAGQRAGDLFGGGVDVAQVGVAVAAARRRADGDEHRLHVAQGGAQVAGEGAAGRP